MKVVPLLTLNGKFASESLMVVLSMYIYIIQEHTYNTHAFTVAVI